MEDNIRIYITADAIVSSLGFSTQENIDSIRSYTSGVSLQNTKTISDSKILAALIDKDRLKEESIKYNLGGYSKLEQIFILSIQSVLEQSKSSLKDKDSALILSSTKGNIDLLERQTNELDENVYLWKMAENIGNHFGSVNPVQVVSSACISGVSACIVAKRLIESGVYKKVVVAGGDTLSHFITSGFISFKSISESICKPFDVSRDGLNLGEASAAILLSKEGGDNDIILSGGAISNDANHISGPSRTGEGLYIAIQQAMEEAGITSKEISFVNTHGTATVFNDDMESKAINLSKLETVITNSLKPYFGHTLGASGLLETIICTHELKENTVFATLGFEALGVAQDITVSARHKELEMKSCIKTASGFGGCNAAIVLSLPAYAKNASSLPEKNIETIRSVSIEKSRIYYNQQEIFKLNEDEFPLFIRAAHKELCSPNMKFFKMDDLCKLGYLAAEIILKDQEFNPEEIGIILSNKSSSLHTDIKHQESIDTEGDKNASPSNFVYTLPNLVLGEICIRHKIQAENTFFISKDYRKEDIKHYAKSILSKGKIKFLIIGWCELLNNNYKADFELLKIQ